MNLRYVLAGLTLSTLPALALEAPATFEDARVEVRAGVTPAAALEQAARERGVTWVGWSVAAIPKLGDVCCFSNNFKGRGCSLAERESSWGTSDRFKSVSSEVYVLVETKDGAPSRVKIFSPDCHVDGHDRRVVWLGPVEAQASLTTLDRLVDRNDDKVSETALVAIAYHRDAQADALLERRALDRSLRSDVREQAIFWSGQTRGESGLKTLDRVMATETDGDLRQNAVFAMSQSDEPGAIDRIKRVAVGDKDPEVRGHALFSLSQTKAPVGEWIVSRLDAERDEEVRDQAVFALSQLDDGTDWLLKVLRSNRDPATVRKALFWLGQSDDPRALREIERILDR
jgi:HEAT repeat protein